MIKEQKESQTATVDHFWMNHSQRVSMETVYTNQAFTWQKDSSYVVLVKNHLRPEADKFQNYADYKNGHDSELKESDKEEEGPYFDLQKQEYPGESIFTSKAKRYFGPEYTSVVLVSPDQTHIAIKVKENHKEPLKTRFDVFKGFNEMQFFEAGKEDSKQGHFLRTDKEYVATIQVSPQTSRIVFSQNYMYCATYSSIGMDLFDLSPDTTTNTEFSGAMRIKTPVFTYNREYNLTYSKLLGVHLNSYGKGDIFENSWVVFLSEIFTMAHCVKLSTIMKNLGGETSLEDAQNSKSIFFEDPNIDNSIKVFMTASNAENSSFWQQCYSQFSGDGSCAAIYSPEQVYRVDLRPLKKKKMPEKRVYSMVMDPKNKTFVFKFGQDDFTFVKHNPANKQILFSHFKPQSCSFMQGISLNASGFDWNNFQLLEASQLTDGTVRMLGIRAATEVFILEKTPNSDEAPIFEDLYPTRLSALQMPYFAYSNGGNTVNICPLFELGRRPLHLVQKIDLEEGEQIQKLVFSSSMNLFIVTRKHGNDGTFTEFGVHAINVHGDIGFQIEHAEERLVSSGQTANEACVGRVSESRPIKKPKSKNSANLHLLIQKQQTSDFTKNKSQIKLNGSDIVKKYRPIVIDSDPGQSLETDIDDVFVCDEMNRIRFLFFAEKRVYFAEFHMQAQVKESEHFGKCKLVETPGGLFKDVKNICRIDTKNYVFYHEKGSQVWNLTFDDKDYSLESAYNESSYSLVAVQADTKMIYVLCVDRNKMFHIRVLKITKQNNQFVFQQSSFINLDASNPHTLSFIEAFQINKSLHDGVLIHNEFLLSKIYDNEKMPSIQHFENYLPQTLPGHENRVLSTSSITINQTARKIAAILSFPSTKAIPIATVRWCLILPYMSNNFISMTNGLINQLNWAAHVDDSYISNTGKQVRETKSLIFQFDMKKWQLFKYNMAGICLRRKTFKTLFENEAKKEGDMQLSQYKILAVNDKLPQLLITPPDQDFMRILRLVGVLDIFKLDLLQTWDTKQIVLDNKPGEPGINLYDEIRKNMKQDNTFKIAVNSRKELAIGFVEKSTGNLIRLFVVMNPPAESKTPKHLLLDVVLQQEPLLGSRVMQQQQESHNSLRGTRGFTLSDTKIIMWSENQFQYSDLSKTLPQVSGRLTLQVSDFKLKKEEDDKVEGIHQYEPTSIIEVVARSDTRKIQNNTSSQTWGAIQELPQDLIMLKIKVSDDDYLMISYDLSNKKQVSSISCHTEAEFMFDTLDECYIFDRHGITKLSNGETFKEFHYKNQIGHSSFEKPGMSWGQRLVPTSLGTVFLVGKLVVLPYSQLSYIQFCSQKKTQATFYPQDYFKIRGQTLLHKHKYNPKVLKKILACFWQLDRRYILSVLVRSQTFQSLTQEAFQELKLLISGVDGQSAQPNVEQPSEPSPAKKDGLFKGVDEINQVKLLREIITVYTDKDKTILDCVIELSDDELINQILFMLSKLPIDLSFKLAMNQFHELQNYARFHDYLNTWFERTTQLQSITVLYTALEPKVQEFRSKVALADETFFQSYPISKPAPAEGEPIETQEKEKRFMRPVDIGVMNTQWLFNQDGQNFFNALIKNEDISLFNNMNLQAIINFQWSIFLPNYRNRIFRPFFFMCYIPFIILALSHKTLDDDPAGPPVLSILAIISLALISIYFVYSVFLEWIEIKASQSFMTYICQLSNIYDQMSLIVLFVVLVWNFYAFKLRGPDERKETVEMLRNFYVFGLLILNVTMLNMIAVFDFWSTFVRSLSQIIKASTPLAACLGIFIVTQSFMFYILLLNNPMNETTYFGVLMDSYRFALGDFNIVDAFGQNQNFVVFWLVFFVGTVVQVLIILNMVIAVMSNAFSEVSATNEANIYKAKLLCLQSYHYLRMTQSAEQEIKKFEYLFKLDVDPVVTDIGPILSKELPESQTINEIMAAHQATIGVKNDVFGLKNSQKQMIDKLYNAIEQLKLGQTKRWWHGSKNREEH